MNHYLDIISRNRNELSELSSSIEYESESEKKTKKGGSKENDSAVIKGCFPPIYKIKKEEIEKEKNIDKTRGFAQLKTAVSIKDIMDNRRNKDISSFITL